MPYNKLSEFLNDHKWKKGENVLTHTRIGSTDYGVYGGSYSITDDIDEFYKLYYNKVFENKQSEYLTETQIKLVMDLY